VTIARRGRAIDRAIDRAIVSRSRRDETMRGARGSGSCGWCR
jgi:hypothetical protein